MAKVVPIQKLTAAKAQINANEGVELLNFLQNLEYANKSTGGTVSQWLHKNKKKLNALRDKHIPKDNDLTAEYAEKHTNSKPIFWDGYEDKIEQPMPGGQTATFGERTWFDRNTAELFSVETDKPLHPSRYNFYKPRVPADKMAEFQEKRFALNQLKYEVQLEKIDPTLLDTLDIPTPQPLYAGSGIDVSDLFYGLLVNMPADSEDVTEVVTAVETETDGAESNTQ